MSFGDSKNSWIELLAELHPRAASVCSRARTVDDRSYREFEATLPHDIRRVIGQCRFEFLIKNGERDNPCHVARCAPPWLEDAPLSLLRCSIPRAFMERGITRVSDLVNRDMGVLRALPWIQVRTVRRIASAIEAAIVHGPDLSSAKHAAARHVGPARSRWLRSGNKKIDVDAAHSQVDNTQTLQDALRVAISLLETRSGDVLSARLGLNGPVPTLEDLAVRYGITRERIRQIETKAIKAIRQLGSWEERFTASIATLSQRSNDPVLMYALDMEDSWFSGISADSELIENLLPRLDIKAYVVQVSPLVKVITSIDQERWQSAVESARAFLGQAADGSEPWDRDECKAVIMTLLDKDAPALGELLWSVVEPDAHFVGGVDGDATLASFGRSVTALVDAVLSSAGEPLHFREIARRVQARHWKPVDVARVHSIVQQRAVKLGRRGWYGTVAHLGLTASERTELAAWLRQRVATAPQRQWICSELLPEAQTLRFGDRVSVYVINAVFGDIEGMIDLGRFAWAVKGGDAAPAVDRIDLRGAVEALLISAGHPLSSDDIRSRLSRERGIKDNMQIVPYGRVFRVGRSKWGLIDRDTGMSIAQRETCLQLLFQVLERRRIALHESELYSAVGNIQMSADDKQSINSLLFGMAQIDRRFKTASGDLVYLATWSGPNRLNKREAIRVVAAEIPENGATIGELRERANAILGRKCDISAALYAVAVWDSTRNLWFRSARTGGGK